MGIDFYDRMWEAEQKEKERFGQRKNEIENELFSQRRRIEELEKENAELKEKLKDAEKAQKQLTKAKEIIKEMLSILPKENIEGVYEISEYAEQFLNSEV